MIDRITAQANTAAMLKAHEDHAERMRSGRPTQDDLMAQMADSLRKVANGYQLTRAGIDSIHRTLAAYEAFVMERDQ